MKKTVHIWVAPGNPKDLLEMQAKVRAAGVIAVSHNVNYFRNATKCDYYICEREDVIAAYKEAGIEPFPVASKNEKIAVSSDGEKIEKPPVKIRGRPKA